MTYIPATDAAVYKTSAITRMAAEGGPRRGGEEEEGEEKVARPPTPPPPPPPPPPLGEASATIEKANNGTTVISIGGGPPAQKGASTLHTHTTLGRSLRPFQDDGPSLRAHVDIHNINEQRNQSYPRTTK